MGKHEIKKKLGGLLALGIISVIITAIISFTSLSKTILPFSFNAKWLSITDLSSSTYNKGWMMFVVYHFSNSVFIVSITIALFILFIKQSKYFPTALVVYFMLRLFLLALLLYFQTVVKGPVAPTINEIILSAIRSLFIPSIWIPYIMLSENARDTFKY